MEKDHGSEFPVIRGAWPTGGPDGFVLSTGRGNHPFSFLIFDANEAGLNGFIGRS